MRQKRGVSRRRFLQTSAAAGTAAAISFPFFVPNHVLGQRGRVGANDRIVVGSIGVGGRGANHLDDLHGKGVPIAGICDVDAKHVAQAVKRVGGRPFTCKDYRQLLERKDIDAIVIATPDHWHALMMIDACQAGKDVYTEKPTCRTIQEGDAMINAAEYYKRVVQVGSQGRSEHTARQCAEYVRNGQVGKVNYVDVWHPVNPNGNNAMSKDGPPPATLDWEQWLGPARWRQYNQDYHPFSFRWLMDIGGGFIRDRGNHALSCVFWTMDADKTGPVSVEATGKRADRGNWDVPITMDVKWEFKNPDWTVTWKQPGQQRPLPGVFDRRGAQVICDWGAEFKGDKGSVILWHGDSANVEKKAQDYTPPANGVHLPVSPGHMKNFLDCIKTREEPIMPIRAGVAVIVLPVIANISYVLGRRLEWDAAKRQFVGDDEANRMLADPYRWPWHL